MHDRNCRAMVIGFMKELQLDELYTTLDHLDGIHQDAQEGRVTNGSSLVTEIRACKAEKRVEVQRVVDELLTAKDVPGPNTAAVRLSVGLQNSKPFWRRWKKIADEGQSKTMRLCIKRCDD